MPKIKRTLTNTEIYSEVDRKVIDEFINSDSEVFGKVEKLKSIFAKHCKFSEEEIKFFIYNICQALDKKAVADFEYLFNQFAENDVKDFNEEKRRAYARGIVDDAIALYLSDSEKISDDFDEVLRIAKGYNIDPFKLAIKSNMRALTVEKFYDSINALTKEKYKDYFTHEESTLVEKDDVKTLIDKCALLASNASKENVKQILSLFNMFFYDKEEGAYVYNVKEIIKSAPSILLADPENVLQVMTTLEMMDMSIDARRKRIKLSPTILTVKMDKIDLIYKGVKEEIDYILSRKNPDTLTDEQKLKSYSANLASNLAYNINNFSELNSVIVENLHETAEVLCKYLGEDNALNCIQNKVVLNANPKYLELLFATISREHGENADEFFSLFINSPYGYIKQQSPKYNFKVEEPQEGIERTEKQPIVISDFPEIFVSDTEFQAIELNAKRLGFKVTQKFLDDMRKQAEANKREQEEALARKLEEEKQLRRQQEEEARARNLAKKEARKAERLAKEAEEKRLKEEAEQRKLREMEEARARRAEKERLALVAKEQEKLNAQARKAQQIAERERLAREQKEREEREKAERIEREKAYAKLQQERLSKIQKPKEIDEDIEFNYSDAFELLYGPIIDAFNVCGYKTKLPPFDDIQASIKTLCDYIEISGNLNDEIMAFSRHLHAILYDDETNSVRSCSKSLNKDELYYIGHTMLDLITRTVETDKSFDQVIRQLQIADTDSDLFNGILPTRSKKTDNKKYTSIFARSNLIFTCISKYIRELENNAEKCFSDQYFDVIFDGIRKAMRDDYNEFANEKCLDACFCNLLMYRLYVNDYIVKVLEQLQYSESLNEILLGSEANDLSEIIEYDEKNDTIQASTKVRAEYEETRKAIDYFLEMSKKVDQQILKLSQRPIEIGCGVSGKGDLIIEDKDYNRQNFKFIVEASELDNKEGTDYAGYPAMFYLNGSYKAWKEKTQALKEDASETFEEDAAEELNNDSEEDS